MTKTLYKKKKIQKKKKQYVHEGCDEKREADRNTKEEQYRRDRKKNKRGRPPTKKAFYKVRLDVPHSLNQIVVEYFDKNRNPLNLTEKIPLTKKEEVLQGIQQIMEINEEKATMGNKKDEQSDKLKKKANALLNREKY